jgi:hypothetical protein
MIIFIIFVIITFACLFYIFFDETERYLELLKKNKEVVEDPTSSFRKWDIDNPGKNEYIQNNRKRNVNQNEN